MDVLPPCVAVAATQEGAVKEPNREALRGPHSFPLARPPRVTPPPSQGVDSSPIQVEKNAFFLHFYRRIQDNPGQKPIVMSSVPDLIEFPGANSCPLLVLPQRVKLWKAGQRERHGASAVWEPWPAQRQSEGKDPSRGERTEGSLGRRWKGLVHAEDQKLLQARLKFRPGIEEG